VGDQPTAILLKHGRSQTVRLPKEFRLPGKEVRVRRIGCGILLEPMDDVAEMSTPFLPKSIAFLAEKNSCRRGHRSSRQCRRMTIVHR
jgi:virulence-associated protein VagC